jgi:branched-chain amino acid transport system ATP-binding protein
LLNCINRVYQQDHGVIEFFGKSLQKARPDEVATLGIARTFQATTAFRDATVRDLVLLGRHVRQSSGFWSCLVGIPAWTGYAEDETKRALEFMDFVGLRDVADYDVNGLSYGTAKLADLARALASEPRLLLLDEPASGLSRSARRWMADLVSRIRKELHITILIVEHDMGLVSRVCDRVVVMKDGSAFADGPPSTTLADPAVVGSLMGMRDGAWATGEGS